AAAWYLMPEAGASAAEPHHPGPRRRRRCGRRGDLERGGRRRQGTASVATWTIAGTATERASSASAIGAPRPGDQATLVTVPTGAPASSTSAPTSGSDSAPASTSERTWRGTLLPRESTRATSSWPV